MYKMIVGFSFFEHKNTTPTTICDKQSSKINLEPALIALQSNIMF